MNEKTTQKEYNALEKVRKENAYHKTRFFSTRLYLNQKAYAFNEKYKDAGIRYNINTWEIETQEEKDIS